jgi:hypothetical protein
MELSKGDAVAADAWQIAATELAEAWIAAPESFLGSADLIAELRLPGNKIADRLTMQLEWVPPILRAPTQHQPDREEIATAPPILPAPTQAQPDREEITTGPPISPEPAPLQLNRQQFVAARPMSPELTRQPDREEPDPANPTYGQADQKESRSPISTVPTPRQLDMEEIVVLLKRGKDLLADGDLAAARLVLQRAADANDAEATLALAATYDPYVLRELKVYSFAADAAMARAWYGKARQLGSSAASRRLEMLTSGAL